MQFCILKLAYTQGHDGSKGQDVIDSYWINLAQGEEGDRCDWLKDKYGFSWQVVPSMPGSLLFGPDTGTG